MLDYHNTAYNHIFVSLDKEFGFCFFILIESVYWDPLLTSHAVVCRIYSLSMDITNKTHTSNNILV